MRFIHFVLLLAVGFTCVGCAQDDGANQEYANQKAIQTVEMSVEMPREAHPLVSYERYYARRADGTIIGIYTNHDKEHRY
ncbi:hypothetical protein [Alteriqipengyuania sp.]